MVGNYLKYGHTNKHKKNMEFYDLQVQLEIQRTHKIWTNSHTRYGQTATQDMDKNNIEFYDLQFQLKIQKDTQDMDKPPHKIWTNSHTRYGQTATQDMDRQPHKIWTKTT